MMLNALAVGYTTPPTAPWAYVLLIALALLGLLFLAGRAVR